MIRLVVSFNFEVEMADMEESICLLQEITVTCEPESTPVDWSTVEMQIWRGDKDGQEDVIPESKAIVNPENPLQARLEPESPIITR